MDASKVNLIVLFVAGLCVVQSVASSIGYNTLDCSHPLSAVACAENDVNDNYQQIPTFASTTSTHPVQMDTDKEYLVKKTSNFVELFYETGIPMRIAKFLRASETELAGKENETLMKDVESIFGELILK